MLRVLAMVALTAAAVAGCASGTGAGSAPASRPSPQPAFTVRSSYPPDPGGDRTLLTFTNAARIPGDTQRLTNIGHAVCDALHNGESLDETVKDVVRLGFTQGQAVVIAGASNGAYCPDVNKGATSSAAPTS
jgi:hypothetical protein